MRYAICILAHDNPDLLSRIVSKVSQPNTDVLVHIDKKSDLTRFSGITGAVFIPAREKIYWGGRSIVLAMRNLIQFAMEKTSCDYILFVSGQDYPLVSPSVYGSLIDPEKNYIEYHPLPKPEWPEGGFDRLKHYYLFNNKDHLLSKIILKIQRSLPFERRNKLNEPIFAGSQWINVNRATGQYILDNWDRYFAYFRFARVPDEMIFQTIVLNSGFSRVTENNNLRYIDFPPRTPHPLYLTPGDLDSARIKNALFCRKIANLDVFEQFEAAFHIS